MGYMHIENLYKNQTILLFKQCYSLEKIHGTSSHIMWDGNRVTFFSGGASHVNFCQLFDVEKLTSVFKDIFGTDIVTVYGEAYGGKEQAMSKTYGDKLKFIVFDVEVEETFVDVPNAEDIATKLGLEFVSYELVDTDVAMLDANRDLPSVQAVRNGCGNNTDKYGFCPPIREGNVLRSIKEFKDNRGNRVISKHKRSEFQERGNQPNVVDADKQKILDDAIAIAEEWVVAVRLEHVLDKLGNPTELSMTGKVIQAMVEDVLREAAGEIVDTKEVRKAIGAKAGQMFKNRIMKV